MVPASASYGARDAGAEIRLAHELVFRPIRSRNAFEETVERLLQAIKLGAIQSGSSLPAQRDLTKKLNVSRATLREAIRALEQAGYLETRRGRSGGTFVVRPIPERSKADALRLGRRMRETLVDALDFRSVIEPGAADIAAQRVTPGTIQGLRDLFNTASAARGRSYRSADSRLHMAIAQMSESPSLIAAVADVQMRLNDLLAAVPVVEANLPHSNAQHERIVNAIADGDSQRARALMAEHVAATAHLLRGLLG